MDPVVHFEMPYEDRERLSRFYESAFGWQMNALGQEMGQYVLATTTETGDAGPTRPGAINGASSPRPRTARSTRRSSSPSPTSARRCSA